MQLILGIIVGLLVLAFLVTIHEGGHALAALWNKVVVEEFAIGFPPTAWSKKLKNGILFKLNYLPLGGYVKLQGEHDAANQKGDYGQASLWAKTQILFAGVAMNFLFAWMVFTILAWTGLPQVVPNQFRLSSDAKIVKSNVFANVIVKDSPADKAGLKQGDVIISIAGQKISSPDEVRALTKENEGKITTINYRHEKGKIQNAELTLNKGEQAKEQGYLGVVPIQTETLKTTWSAPIVGFGTAVQFAKITVQGLGDLIVNFFGGLAQKVMFWDQQTSQKGSEQLAKSGEAVAGPIGILGVLFPALLSGTPTEFFLFVAIISLTLAVMNALPIPALDGGRWFVTILFRILKKPLSKQLEEKIHGTGMAILLLLTLVITISDVWKLF